MGIKVRGLTPLIQVFDMPASVAFYRDLLGFEIISQSEPGDNFDWAMLQLDRAVMMLNTAYERDRRPPAPDHSRIAAHEDTGLFFECPDVDAMYEQLREKGVNITPPKNTPYGMKQLYVIDPDGYVLCFQWPAK